MGTFNASDEMFDVADLDGLTLDEMRDLPYHLQVGLDLTAGE